MNLEPETCYRALMARDPRFDGLFFIGATSTGIYCRPVCPARTPRRDRCVFFGHAAAAERAGFRPCLRCRPELAPGHAPVDAVRTTAQVAAARIEAGMLGGGQSLESLAEWLGLSSRQLRRAVRSEFGVSPIELAQTRRLLLAKQLLTETALPITEVAYASGFESLRRFNFLFRTHYQLTPTALRRAVSPSLPVGAMRLTMAYRPPYAWAALLRYLEGRCTQGVERVCDQAYERTVAIGERRGWLRVSQVAGRNALCVEIATALTPVLPSILARVRALFDLDARPDVIGADLGRDRRLSRLVRRRPGLRLAGAFDGFELGLRAILGQRVTVKGASTLSGRLTREFGSAVETPLPGLDRAAPTAERLAEASVEELASIGLPAAQARALRAFAEAVATGRIDLSPGRDPEETVRALEALPGIGPWTAQYVAMRALQWPDAWPDGDLGLMKATGIENAKDLRKAAEAWRPWRGYAAAHLWESMKPGVKERYDD